MKENKTPQVKEFSISMYMKMQGSGLTEIIPLICSLAIWGQYPLFSYPEFSRGSPKGMAAVWRLLDGKYSFLPEFHPWRLQLLMTVTSLCTDTAENIPFLSYLNQNTKTFYCSGCFKRSYLSCQQFDHDKIYFSILLRTHFLSLRILVFLLFWRSSSNIFLQILAILENWF